MVRSIAFYLPQFHPIPENDQWWGNGFTEWTNVRKALPRFEGHNQPHVPAQLGYYDLRDPEIREAQADLARAHGIHGFCYYHYWFNGKRLLETPFNEVLASGKPDFPFCLCWANENWTRRWDGSDHEVLIAQNYSDEDSLNFINSLIPAFLDERYIRVNGKPLLVVYRTGLLPDPQRTAEIWREAMINAGVGDLYLVRIENQYSKTEVSPENIGFDAAIEFAPYWGLMGSRLKRAPDSDNGSFYARDDLFLYDYETCMRNMLYRQLPSYKLFRGIFPGWDNSPRRKEKPTVFVNSSSEWYAYWLSELIKYTKTTFVDDEQLVFINAWNEWGEGCHLEPDQRDGLSYLEETRKAVCHSNSSAVDVCTINNDDTNKGTDKVDSARLAHSIKPEDFDPYNILLTRCNLNVLNGKLSAELERLNWDIERLIAEINKLCIANDKLQLTTNQIAKDKENLAKVVDALIHSISWKITSPFRRVMDGINKIYHSAFLHRLYMLYVMSAHRFKRLLKHINRYERTIFNRKPRITVGIASYNHSKYLSQCIESALMQDYDNFDVIIVDDKSTDIDNYAILEKYGKHPKVRVIYKDKTEGISASLNCQIVNSSAEWIAFLDCDDYLPPNALSIMASFIKNNSEKNLIYSNRIEVDENNRELQKIWFGNRAVNENVFEELLKGMVSSHLKLIHKDVFLTVGLFDSRFDGIQDYDLFLRVAFYLPKAFGYIDNYLYFHRIHPSQNTIVDSDKHKMNLEKVKSEALFRKDVYSGNFDKLISIVILSFNRGDRTKKTVQEIIAKSKNINKEIIIWDNCSTDEQTHNLLRELAEYIGVTIHYSDKNLRCSGGRKAAVHLTRGEYVYFLDNDIEIQDGAIEELIIRLNESSHIAGACSRVAFPDDTLQFNGASFEIDDGFIFFKLLDSGKSIDDSATMMKTKCDWIPGGATMYRAHVFKSVEIDDGYINAFEDNDFSSEVTKKLGMDLVNCPTSKVIHYHINLNY